MQSLGMQILNPQSCRKSWGFLTSSFVSLKSALFWLRALSPATLSSDVTFQGICGCAAHVFTKCVLSTQAPGLQPESGTGSHPCETDSHLSFLTSLRRQGKLHHSRLIDEELRQEDGENLTKLLMIQDYFRKETKKLSLNIRLGPSPSLPIAILCLITLCFRTLSSSPLGTSPHGPLNSGPYHPLHISVALRAFPCHFISLQ